MRGYFAIGTERISKPVNMTANPSTLGPPFRCEVLLTIGAHPRAFEAKSDTSKAVHHLPVYHWANADEMILPFHCNSSAWSSSERDRLPSFRHPLHAAYVLGPELGVLSEALLFTLRSCSRISDGFLHQRRNGRRDSHLPHPGLVRSGSHRKPQPRIFERGRAAPRTDPRK